MFLKSMEMFGFKSFADKTPIQFETGITAIVGPNGCGKSNIVDAVKWVLGEKSAKNIRGVRMEDIIFSGTEERKPVSLAEVSLTIDNSNKILDIESDSVTIGRRIFRDGESEYLINKSPVRLKDLEKLFMDTGIGKSAYSVMEQGKMDLILSTRAEDRRYIFEEAAGISRYKHQKKESLKKLEATGNNLSRINDIINEIEREKNFKEKQAVKTEKYLQLMKNHNTYDLKINLFKFRGLSKKQDRLTDDIDKFQKQRDEISVRVSSTSAENERDEKRRNDLQHQIFEFDKRLNAYVIRLEDIDQKTERNRSQIDIQIKQKENIEKKIRNRNESLNFLKEEKENAEKSAVEIKGKIEKDKEKLNDFFNTRKRKIESIHNSRDKIDSNREKIGESEERLKVLRSSLEEVIKRLLDAIEKRKAELQGSETEREDVKINIDSKLKNIDELIIKIKQSIESGIYDDLLNLVNNIDIDSLKNDIKKFESYEDGFRSILFDKTGVHAEKENLDKDILENMDLIEALRLENIDLDKFIQNEQKELEDVNSMISRVEIDISTNETNKDWIESNLNTLNVRIKDANRELENYKEDLIRSDKIVEDLKKEIEEWENKLIEFSKKSESLKKNITELTENRRDIEEKIHNRKNVSVKDEEELKRIVEKITNLDKSKLELMFKKDNIAEYIWTEYEKKISDLRKIEVDELEFNSIQQELIDIKKKIQNLGPINNLAIEEYKDLKKRFQYYINQKNDIEKAREDILSVIADINETSVKIFIETFTDIQKNFSEIFKQLFEGGDATLQLVDMENVLESGIDILVRPPGKKLKNINLLSGGERALTAIALLFATYMVRPSPFCFLDEIDAPLDDQNVVRFVKMLRDFSKSTQFIIVTHNKNTMSISESLYGVTMEEPGVSRIVSLKMRREGDAY